MSKEQERRQNVGYSSSTLSQCPRQYVLAARNDYFEDPDDYYARWMGSLGHLAVESSGPYPGITQEIRYRYTITVDGVGVEISGQPDWYDRELRQVDDYKYTGYPPNSPREEHEAQLNVYAWLLENNSLPVEEARVIYLHPKSRQSGKRHTIFQVPMWTDDAVARYISSKISPHIQYAKDNNIAKLSLDPKTDLWKAGFCPFRHPCNPGQCCLAKVGDASRTQIKAPLSDERVTP
jgi:hypothetical protein